jgi:oligopeptide transport system substrate-binding protein
MMRAHKLVNAALALVVATGILAGCSMPGQRKATEGNTSSGEQKQQQTQQAGPATGGQFRMFITNPETMDPHRWTWGVHIDRMGVFEAPYRYDQNMNPIPAAAEKAEVSQDGLTWTITFRKGLKWSNGDPLTAKDWEYSMKRVMDPKTWEGGSSSYMDNIGIKGAKDFKYGKTTDPSTVGVVAKDDQTLVITLEKPNPDFLYRLCEPWALPVHKATVEKFGKEWAKPGNMVSNGPFVLKSWTVNAEMILERNPNYAGAFPAKLDSVKLVFSQDYNPSTLMLSYQNNELDFVSLQPGDVDRVKADPELSKQLQIVDTGVYKALPLLASENDLLLKNAKLRQAFAMAIDRKKLAETVSKGTVTPLETLIPPTISDWEKDLKHWSFNPTEAKKLLAEAGYPDGKGLPKLTLLIAHGSTIDPFILGVVDEWKNNLGVEVKLENVEAGIFYEKLGKTNGPDYLGFYDNAWVNPYRSADAYATGGLVQPVHMLPGKALQKYRDINADKNKTPDQKAAEIKALLEQELPAEAKEWDSLLKQADEATDRNKQIELRKKAAKLREDLMVAIPLYTWKRFNMVKPQFKGVEFNPFLNALPTYFNTIYVQK